MRRTTLILWALTVMGCGRTADSTGTVDSTGGSTGNGGATSTKGGASGAPSAASGGSTSSGGTSSTGGFISIPPDPDPPDYDCVTIVSEPEILPFEIVVLVDRSASMGALTASGATWLDAVTEALTELVEIPLVSEMTLALGYFPASSDAPSTCTEPFELAVPHASFSENAELVSASIAEQIPAGDRPLGHAFAGALALQQMRPEEPYHRRAIAVITAGPSDACEPMAADEIDALASAAGVDVTWIALGTDAAALGLDESLHHVASIRSDDPAPEILHRLAMLMGVAAPCEIVLTPLPGDEEFNPELVNLTLEPFDGSSEPLFFVSTADGCDENGGEGWHYDDPNIPSSVLLCDETCDRTIGAGVTVHFGCSRQVPRP